MSKVKILFLIALSFLFVNSVSAGWWETYTPWVWEMVVSAAWDDINNDAVLVVASWGTYNLILSWEEVETNIKAYWDFYFSGSTFYATLQRDNWKWFFMEWTKKSDDYDDLSCMYDNWYYCTADKWTTWYVIYKSKVLDKTYDENITDASSNYPSSDYAGNYWVNLKKWGRTVILINWITEVTLWYQDYYPYPFFSKDGSKFIITSSDNNWSYLLYKSKKIRYYSYWGMMWNKFNFIVQKLNWSNYDFFYNELDLTTSKISTKKITGASDIMGFFTLWDNSYNYIKTLISGWYSLVIDWKESGKYDSITYLWNSSDYKYVIYSVEKNWESFLLVNLKEFK